MTSLRKREQMRERLDQTIGRSAVLLEHQRDTAARLVSAIIAGEAAEAKTIAGKMRDRAAEAVALVASAYEYGGRLRETTDCPRDPRIVREHAAETINLAIAAAADTGWREAKDEAAGIGGAQ